MSGGLQKNSIGFPTALATAIGLIVASSVLLTATQGFAAAGPVFAAAIGVALFLMFCVAANLAEMSGIMPFAGSIYDYVSAGLGRAFGIVAALSVFLVVHIFAGTAEVAAIGVIASSNFEVLQGLEKNGSWIVGVLIVAGLAIINMLGVKNYGRVEVVFAFSMIAMLLVFGAVGTFQPTTSGVSAYLGESQIGYGFGAVLAMVGLAMFLFVGIEFVTPLASELKQAATTVPRAMFVGLALVAVAMLLFGAAVLRQVENVEIETGVFLLDTPMAASALGEKLFGQWGRLSLGVAVLLASAATINTLLAATPRIFYAMAKDGALPAVFAYLHPRYKTPWVGIVVSAIIPIVYAIVLNGNVDGILTLVLAAVCAWLLAYVLVCVSVISLRIRYPGLRRPYRSPLFPLTQILGIGGMLTTIWYIAPPFLERAEIYKLFVIMIIVCAIYALCWELLIKRRSAAEVFRPVDPRVFADEES